MRVFVGPRTALGSDKVAAAVVCALAGPDGSVVSLRDVGVRNLSRVLSAAEVALLREALTGGALTGSRGGGDGVRTGEGSMVGYVCRGGQVGNGQASGPTVSDATATGATNGEARLVAVTDHANLTWGSPLTGPNDDSAGPRFPSMTGIYAPEAAVDRLGAAEGMMVVVPGVVAGVRDDRCPTTYEDEVARAQGHAAVSSELVPVVIVAAHLGLRVAAVVLVSGS